jgi:hypothetical protein
MSIIPVTQKTEIGRSRFKASQGKMLLRPHLNQPSWCDGTYLSSQAGNISSRIMVKASQVIKMRPDFDVSQ